MSNFAAGTKALGDSIAEAKIRSFLFSWRR
jgi:hypothetical protein